MMESSYGGNQTMQRDLMMSTEYIAGMKTIADWHALKARLEANAQDAWSEAFTEFFRARLETRYLHPIRVLQQNGSSSGEGFSIVAIQCSLIEFLESTVRGVNYRYRRRDEHLGDHEYSMSRPMFIDFLCNRLPFSAAFNEQDAADFYASVRCGLLHEARTKNGWLIWARSEDGAIVSTDPKIVYRDDFQEALLAYIEEYGVALQTNATLQAAFIRKFDDLCT
jgi:hypothetical protein